MSVSSSFNFAYYCSGHGFGHATRVTAIIQGLLSRNHRVTIVSSAPESVFTSVLNHPSLRCGYRFVVLEPTVVQPKAYHVDPIATFNNLDHFLTLRRETLIQSEHEWIQNQQIDCALIDAPFLPCEAGIPSVIISNFTFDSCYSYLSAFNSDQVGDKIDLDKLNDLVAVTVNDYSRAELLLRLPGSIPIPGFDPDIELPATTWVQGQTHSFTAEVDEKLKRPREVNVKKKKKVLDMPLIVRPLSKSAYDPKTKLKLLKSLGVPTKLLNIDTKILLVSFGGQIIPRPKSILTNADHRHQTESHANTDQILPPGWIAIICGLSSAEIDSERPDRFYSISDSAFDYVPDLTAMANVVLGKLGYGTCSEVLATRTPFISVPRKMFVEEYGLKRLMKQASITNIEMSIEEFEGGQWASHILLADQLGQEDKLEFSRSQLQHKEEFYNQSLTGVGIIADHLEKFMMERNPTSIDDAKSST